MTDNEIMNLVGQTSKILFSNDQKRAEIKRTMKFLDEQLLNPQPKEGMTVEELVQSIHTLQADLNKLMAMVDEHDLKIKKEFEDRGLGVLSATAEAMKDFLPYF